jgi:hypothetical protein
MMKRSGMSSDGKKRTKAPGETVLAWMERWTSFVKMSETKIVEKQKGTSVANMLKAKAGAGAGGLPTLPFAAKAEYKNRDKMPREKKRRLE